MDELYEYFADQNFPRKLRIALVCCLNMCSAVKNLVEVWAEQARPYERMCEWINR